MKPKAPPPKRLHLFLSPDMDHQIDLLNLEDQPLPETDTMKIVEFYGENIKKLRAVRIAPGPHVTLIDGKNEAGKTTALNILSMLFGGAKAMPKNPIRRGESSASAGVNLGDLVVEMTLDPTRGRTITVKGKDGKKMPGGAQEILDRLYSAVAFDPFKFANAKPEEQAETLRKLVGIDFSELDAKYDKLYGDRETEGRDLTRAKAQLSAMAAPSSETPDEEISVKDLIAEKDAAERTNREHSKVFDALERARRLRETKEEALEAAKQALAKAQSSYDGAVADEDAADEATRALSPDIDVSPIVNKVGTSEATNRAVRAKKERAAKAAEVAQLEASRKKMTDEMAAIEDQKATTLKAVKWPIEGLGFGSGGVTYQGFPLEEASASGRIKVGLAIGMASHPELQAAIIRDGSLLDEDSMREVEAWSVANDFGVLIERVGTDDPGSVVIEEGTARPWTPKDSKRA
jgi:hypothetical protein